MQVGSLLVLVGSLVVLFGSLLMQVGSLLVLVGSLVGKNSSTLGGRDSASQSHWEDEGDGGLGKDGERKRRVPWKRAGGEEGDEEAEEE